ncbi:MAG TPA: DUF11 domain-containing protein [Ramlibacter sp.]|nr:DUF11 domain-containing protein [Ramlibacter sp.]
MTWLVGVAALVAAFPALAVGTPAGTKIPNEVTVNYTINGKAEVAKVAAPVITVAEIIDVVVTLQSSGPLSVSSPDISKALTFAVTNTGNGTQTFRLSRNNAIEGDQFDPINASAGAVYLESGAEPGFQASGANADIAYIPGVNDPLMPADTSRTAYLASNIPASLTPGALGNLRLTAASVIPGAPGARPGTSLAGLGYGGVDALVGFTQAQSAATGGYIVSTLSLNVAKTVTQVRDPAGNALVMPGSVLTYRVVMTLTGNGTADNLAMNDPLPPSISYVPGSITVNGAARTDAADADNASFTTNAGIGAVTVLFGNTPAPATQVIEFKAIVN